MADVSQRECLGGTQARAESMERLAGSGERESGVTIQWEQSGWDTWWGQLNLDHDQGL